jgi:hypothetical protein
VSRGTPVAGLIFVRPGIEFKPIEGDALDPDPYAGELRARLSVEAILVHAEIPRRISKAEQAGHDNQAIRARSQLHGRS